MAEMVTVPRDAAAYLVAAAVHQLWNATEDTDLGGCCPYCCGPCHALRTLDATGQLDQLYGAYLAIVGGDDEVWDADNQRIDREWLTRAWSVDLGCHGGPEMAPDATAHRRLHDRTAISEEDL